MKLFSQRKGLKLVKTVLQVDSMDSDLRNRLWNALILFYWNQVKEIRSRGEIGNKPWDEIIKNELRDLYQLIIILWHSYFKKPIDTIKNYWGQILEEIRIYFFNCEWGEVYDFIEFIANNYPDSPDKINQKFMDHCNCILEEELSAYRFVGGRISQITSEVEISEIEEALKASEPLIGVHTHLKRALELLADRGSPDYRNSIKEAISAVEAICIQITGEKSNSLGAALNKIEDRVSLHPALKKAFRDLYGYTSDAEGIRHALLDKPTLSFEDAKFMLVSCSAFINYLLAKVTKVRIG